MILVNNPGSESTAYSQLRHAEWSGWTFADTIFPAFLWIVGVAATLSTARRIERGDDRARLLRHAIKRAGLLFLCGLLLEGFPDFHLSTWQVTGVLQKIALAYLLATGLSLWTTWRGQLLDVLGIFLVYLGLMILRPGFEGSSGPWTMDGNFARYLDELVLGRHRWLTPSHNDPDGIMGVLASTTTVLLGGLAGRSLPRAGSSRSPLLLLVGSGLALVCAGALLSNWVPIMKILWTPSYSLFMAGLSSIAFGACHWAIENRPPGWWLRPFEVFEVFGMNAIAAYVVSRIALNLLKVHVKGESIYTEFLLLIANPANASLLYALLNVLVIFGVVAWMRRRRIFLKL